jgi:hypothetical protein
MAKFVIVDKVPAELRKNEHVIEMPSFLEEIRLASARNLNKKGQVSPSFLRSIASMIAINYDKEFDPLRHLKAHDYDGVGYENEQDLSKIVLAALERDYPAIFDRYLEHKIKNRPFGTKVIYFVGPHSKSSVFYAHGIDSLDVKDVDTFLGLKPKKTVGKPAVTNEQVQNAQDNKGNE